MTENIPPARWITCENATVFETEEAPLNIGEQAGGRFPWPVDDGKDDPDWEYHVVKNLDGSTLRVPVRRRYGCERIGDIEPDAS